MEGQKPGYKHCNGDPFRDAAESKLILQYIVVLERERPSSKFISWSYQRLDLLDAENEDVDEGDDKSISELAAGISGTTSDDRQSSDRHAEAFLSSLTRRGLQANQLRPSSKPALLNTASASGQQKANGAGKIKSTPEKHCLSPERRVLSL